MEKGKYFSKILFFLGEVSIFMGNKNKQIIEQMKNIILSLGVVLALSSCGGNSTESTTTTDSLCCDTMVAPVVDTTAVVDTAVAVETTKVVGE